MTGYVNKTRSVGISTMLAHVVGISGLFVPASSIDPSFASIDSDPVLGFPAPKKRKRNRMTVARDRRRAAKRRAVKRARRLGHA